MLPHEYKEIIKNKEFSRTLHGYNPRQVDRYLQKMITYYNVIYNNNKILKRTVLKHEKINKYLNDALIQSEKSSGAIKANALKEAEKIKDNAKREAEAIKKKALDDAKKIRSQAIHEGQEFIHHIKTNRKLFEEKAKDLIGNLYYVTRGKINSLQRELMEELELYRNKVEGTLEISTENDYVPEEKMNWKYKEQELVVGYITNKDIKDSKGETIVSKSTVVTTEVIDLLVEKGLYGELFSAIGDELNEYS
jgi:cell division initiation protein